MQVKRHMSSAAERAAQAPIIFARYATANTSELAKELGLTKATLRDRAAALGVTKCPTFIAKSRSDNIKNSACGFKKGSAKFYADKRIPTKGFMEENIEALNAAGLFGLADLTRAIMVMVKVGKEYDFLIIRDER